MLAVEGGSTGHCTVTLRPYALPNTNIVLWDTWGVTMENYRDALVGQLLEGALPAGAAMSAPLLDHDRSRMQLRAMHNVLFFFPAAVVADPAMVGLLYFQN